MNDKTYVKHVKTGEVFELGSKGDSYHYVYDNDGEYRMFKNEMLTPYEPDDAWEDCRLGSVRQIFEGLEAYVLIGNAYQWKPVPSEFARTITRDGKLVVQRRKG